MIPQKAKKREPKIKDTSLEYEITAPDWMIIDAIRYAVGRRSYQVQVTAEWVRANFYRIKHNVKSIIQKDLQTEIDMHERIKKMQRGESTHLGQSIDEKEWYGLMEFINGEMQRVQKVGGDSTVS
jgi:hypothetical protein